MGNASVFSCDMKQQSTATIEVVLSRSPSSNNSSRYCPPTPLPSSGTPTSVHSTSRIFMFLFFLDSCDSSGSALLWEPLRPMVVHLRHFAFPHFHGARQVVQRHHQFEPHPGSELCANCSAMPVSRMLRIVRYVGSHSSAPREMEDVVFEGRLE